jgi:ribosomal protein S18 acetylase RimI-like enzyme
MKISSAERSDLPRILSIQKQAYLSEAAIYDDYSIPPLLQSLDEMNAEFESKTFLKADVDGALVGSVRVKLVDATCVIERLIVDPKFQKRGIGSALLVHAESVFAEARRFELFTGSRSTANIRLYGRHGYARFREQPLSSAVTLVYMQKLRGPNKRLQAARETRAPEARR